MIPVIFMRFYITVNSNVIHELQRASRLNGIYTRVAKRLGLSVNHVREVGVGRRTSARVLREITREFKKMVSGEKAA